MHAETHQLVVKTCETLSIPLYPFPMHNQPQHQPKHQPAAQPVAPKILPWPPQRVGSAFPRQVCQLAFPASDLERRICLTLLKAMSFRHVWQLFALLPRMKFRNHLRGSSWCNRWIPQWSKTPKAMVRPAMANGSEICPKSRVIGKWNHQPWRPTSTPFLHLEASPQATKKRLLPLWKIRSSHCAIRSLVAHLMATTQHTNICQHHYTLYLRLGGIQEFLDLFGCHGLSAPCIFNGCLVFGCFWMFFR